MFFSDQPSAPENLQASDVHEDYCKLDWLPPSDDGGAPITGTVYCSSRSHGFSGKAVDLQSVQGLIPIRSKLLKPFNCGFLTLTSNSGFLTNF